MKIGKLRHESMRDENNRTLSGGAHPSKLMRFVFGFLSLLFSVFSIAVFPAYAQSSQPIDYEDYYSVGITHNIGALGDDVMGDSIDVDTGAITFRHVDIDIPGNSSIPVRFGRIANQYAFTSEKMFSGWTPLIPHLVMRVGDDYQLRHPKRCTDPQFNVKSSKKSYNTSYWNTLNLSLDGSREEVFKSSGDFSGIRPKYITKSYTKLECIKQSNGFGEAFKAKDSNGTEYWLDHLIEYDPIRFNVTSGVDVYAKSAVYFVTKIRDKYGNEVNYEYGPHGITKIKDSAVNTGSVRQIDITYGSDGLISTAKAGARTWKYFHEIVYNSRFKTERTILKTVELPNGQSWLFDSMAIGRSRGDTGPCFKYWGGATRITHPSGTKAVFYLTSVPHSTARYPIHYGGGGGGAYSGGQYSAPPSGGGGTMGGTSAYCDNYHGQQYHEQTDENPKHFYSPGIYFKELEIFNSDGSSVKRKWDYEYINKTYRRNQSIQNNWYNFEDSDKKLRRITDPTGVVTEYDINRAYGWAQGQMHEIRTYANASAEEPIKKIVYDRRPHRGIGLFMRPAYNSIGQNYIHTVKGVETHQDGDTYTKAYEYDEFGFQILETSSSNVSTTQRSARTKYSYDFANWRFPMVKEKSLESGSTTLPTSSYLYNTKGDVSEEKNYGKTRASYTYHQDGNIHTVKDALGRTVTLSNYYRGVPRTVTRPDKVPLLREVNDFGQVTSQTDAMKRKTKYSYNKAGRLTKIDPTGNLWLDTDISYDNLSSDNLSSGGLIQTITKGQSKTTITYDSMLRPTLERTEALDTGWSSYVNTKYDGLGRVIFKSQPSSDPGEIKGITTTYDGLGRVYDIIENNDDNLKTKHRYDSDHKHRIYDPSGAYTEYKSYGYGGPGNTDYSHIDRYAANGTRLQRTQLHKNTWGQLVRLQQSGNHDNNNVDKSQWFEYDDQQRLCSHWTPEQGRTKYNYDAAGQLIEYVKGHGTPTCGQSLGDLWQKVTLTYDDLGRQLKTDFYAPGTPDITKTYDANGNVLTINRGEGGTAVNWTYEYNDLNLIVAEDLSVDGRTFTIRNSYNTSGHLKSRRLPAMRTFEQAPDGLGRPTQIQWSNGDETFADNINYHPNGSVHQMTYGNGQYYSQILNDRLLPQRLLSYKGANKAVDLSYGYDVRGKITSITDGAVNDNNRSYSYDGLGHLKTASGPWGNGSYSYDSLGNLRSKTLGDRKVTLTYDSRNRVVKSVDTGFSGTRTIAYDNRGNVTSIDNLTMIYDMSDQPTAVSGSANGVGPANGNYLYDGNLKRVKSFISDGKGYQTIYNIFDSSGKLVHIFNVTKNEKTEYVTGPTGTIARVTNGTPTYMHPDHLGSAQAGTDHTGAVKWREQYTPFGEQIQNPAANDNLDGFTGHIKDKATGLNYMQARYYDPVIGRFLSIDPVGFLSSGNDPRYFNRYSYTANDPVNLIDPSGMFFGKLWNSIFGGAVERSEPQRTGTNVDVTRNDDGTMDAAEVPVRNFTAETNEGIAFVGPALANAAGATGVGRFGPNTSAGATRGRSAFATGSAAADDFSRPLTASDMGLAGSIDKLSGTFSMTDGVATARIDMIQGKISNPFNVVRNLSNTARQSGASSLNIEGTIANPRLYNALSKRYNMQSAGATDVITVPLP